MDNQNSPKQMKEKREPYSDFLPRFRVLIEAGNWSENLSVSMGLLRAIESEYTKIHKNQSDPLHERLRSLHGTWWQQRKSGQVSIYRFTTQYIKPSTYRLIVSCDDDEDYEYFTRTTRVYDNSKDLENVARSIIRKAIGMFEED